MKEYKYNDILFFIGMPVQLYKEDKTLSGTAKSLVTSLKLAIKQEK